MLTWILSLAGLGGIGAALAFIPGAGPLALAWGGKLVALVRDNPWPAALIAALLWGAYERHDAIHARALTVQWKAAYDGQASARKVDQQSIADLRAANARQNLAVMNLAKESQRRQEAAQSALRSAKADAAKAEAVAARLDAHAAAPGNPACKTSPAVIAARGSL